MYSAPNPTIPLFVAVESAPIFSYLLLSTEWQLAVSKEVESCYPLTSACSFLAINYYEEASNRFQECLIEALIPERSCLLNDVCYPLDRIDEFYFEPWRSVEYDREFLSKEAEKVGERIVKCSANVSPLDDTEIILLDEDIFPKSDNLFDEAKFKELSLQELHEELFHNVKYFCFLEVPQIPFSLKKNNSALNDLLKNLPLMELEDIFEKEINLTFEDIETTLECDTTTNESDTFLLEFDKEFEEIVLPMIPDEGINFEHFSFNSKENNLSLKSTNDWTNKNNDLKSISKDKNGRNFLSHFDQSPLSLDFPKSGEHCHLSTPSYAEETLYSTAEENGKTDFLQNESKQQILVAKPSISHVNSTSDFEIHDSDKQVAPNNYFLSENHKSISNLRVNEDINDGLIDLCNDDFFAEKFLNFGDSDDEGGSDRTLFRDSVIIDVHELNSKINDISDSDSQVTETLVTGSSEVFLKKISDLDLSNTDEIFDSKTLFNKENQTNHSAVKQVSAYRDKPLTSQIPSCENFRSENKTTEKLLCKSQNLKSFSLLSSFLHSRKKESGAIWSAKSPESYSLKSKCHEIDVKDTDGQASRCRENLSLSEDANAKSVPHLQNEEIMVEFPDGCVELILMYESAAIYYIQKLLPWEGFQFSSDLTIVDISLDKMRFLLNQEIKNCRDQNISPLEGGVHFSHYIQLLILHGILKSLNCFINFGAQLSISSLYDFEKKHMTALKGCFENLLSKVYNFVEKSSLSDAVHPKVKDLCVYLQGKYYFCKQNCIPFKVLIIVKEYLTFFHSSYEAFMKTLLPEITVVLIPESCYLQETDIFREDECIYTVSALSVSKNMPWRNLTLVVEYERGDSTCWKTICNQENVIHCCMKFHPLPLKTLREIQSLPLHEDPLSHISNVSSKIPIVVSPSIYSKYNFLSSMNEKQNISLFERSYSEFFPHLHFADVTICHKSGAIIITMLSFSNGDFLDSLVDRLFGLHLKYEICWIIVHDNALNMNLNEECLMKIQHGYLKFYCIAMNMKALQLFKIKFLYAKNEEDVIKYINQIITKNMKIYLNKLDCYPRNSLSAEMSEEELFLVSFPSLNPVVVAVILSAKISLYELMNLKLKELCNKFDYISERFLVHFYRLIQERVNLDPNPYPVKKENIFESMQNSLQNPSCSKDSKFQLLLHSDCEETNKFISSIKKYQTTEDDFCNDHDTELTPTFDSNSQLCDSLPFNYSEMSMEEIDKNYRALQHQDLAFSAFDVDFEESLHEDGKISCKWEIATSTFASQSNLQNPKRRKNLYDSPIQKNNGHRKESQPYSLTDPPNRIPATDPVLKYSIVQNISRVESNYSHKNVPFDPDMKPHKSLFNENETLNSSESEVKELNPSLYMYAKKRKLPPDFSDHKSMKFCSQSSVLCNSSRIQKGLSSKTVCKQTWFKSIPETQKMAVSESSSQFFQSSSFADNSTSQSQPVSNKDFDDIPDSTYTERLGSPWMSQRSITLTPRQGHRLSYERIPGKKGQTRLVFH